MSRKHKKDCTILNYIEYFLNLASTNTGCVSISTFYSLIGIPIGIASSVIGVKLCVIAAGSKKYKSIIMRKKKKHDKIVLLTKSKLSKIKVLLCKALINSNITHDEFVLINNVLKEYDEMKKEIKNLKSIKKFSLFIKQCYCIA